LFAAEQNREKELQKKIEKVQKLVGFPKKRLFALFLSTFVSSFFIS